MSSLFDVGKSALNSYRQSLAVTGQNIANINTEGYKRREAKLEEVSGSQGSITSIQDQSGLGVRVSDIKRSFDSFMQDRSRFAQSEFKKFDAYVEQLEMLENQLMPGEGGVGKRLSGFFNSLYDIAVDPTSSATRMIALELGHTVADAFVDTANQLEKLKSDTEQRMEQTLTALNTLTDQLVSVNKQLTSNGQSGVAPNAVLDVRDRVLTDIAKLVTVSVSYSEIGTANVTLGSSGMGPTIVDAKSSAKLEHGVLNNKSIQVFVNQNGAKATTNQASGGVVQGLVMAFGSIDEALSSLDRLAVSVTREVNLQHQMGITLDGQKGGEMFAVNGISITPNIANRGSSSAELEILDTDKLPASDLTLSYDQEAELWRLRDASGIQLAAGNQELNASGIKIIIHGAPKGSDYFTLSPILNAASRMKFLLKRPEDFAAASNSNISSDVKNSGDAAMSVTELASGDSNSTVGNTQTIDKVMANSSSPILASEFLKTGLAAVVPAGTTAVDLSSFSRQGSAQFQLSALELQSLSAMTMSFTGTSNNGPHTLDLSYSTSFPQASASDSWASMEDVASALNRGLITTSSSQTISDLGLYASGSNTTLTLSLATGDFDTTSGSAPTVSVGVGQLQGTVQTATDASDIQIFTREGRHIAGSSLTSSEIDALLAFENGFNVQADYNADYLNGIVGGYRGVGIETQFSGGLHTMNIGSNGSGATALAANGYVPPNPTLSHVLAVTLGNSNTASATIPLGSSASTAATSINTAMADIGVHATAHTRVELKSFSATGEVNFGLEGVNTQPIAIVAQITPNNLNNLVLAINIQTEKTGITASLSSNSDRIILESESGGDILISDVTAASPDFTARIINDDGTTATSDVVIGSSSSPGILDHARFSGIVKLVSSDSISLVANGTTFTSSLDPETNGFVSVSSDATFEKKKVNFEVNADSDGSSGSADGLRASSASASYSLTIPTSNSSISFTANVNASSLSEVNQSSLNRALVDALRVQGPLASLSGGSVVTTTQVSTFGFVGSESIESGSDSLAITINGTDVTVDLTAGSGVTTHAELAAAFVTAVNNANLDVVATTQVSGGQQQFILTGKTAGQSFTVETFSFTDAANSGSEGSTQLISNVEAVPTPSDGKRVYVDFDSERYEISMASGEVVVSGGEAGRVTAYFDADGRLQVFGGGSLSGKTLSLSSDTDVAGNSSEAAAFGLATNTARLTGQEITVTSGMSQLDFDFSGTPVALDIATDGTVTTTPSPSGLTARYEFTSGSSGPGRLILEFEPTTYSLSITAPEDAYGFKVGTTSAKIRSDHIEVSSTDGTTQELSATATSLAQQRVSLTDLPFEDLLVLTTGTGPRLLAAKYDIMPVDNKSFSGMDSFTVQIKNPESGQIEIIDTETKHSIATRYLDENRIALYRDNELQINGTGVIDDEYHFIAGVSQPGDARNINAIINLQNNTSSGANRTSFSEMFSAIVSRVGTNVQANEISAESADARQQAAMAAEVSFSGVNLDNEASALIEFQQAYQASARILTTAREMFRTLIDVV